MSRGLKFCPETNDLLYPRENKQLRKLEYYCKNCPYVETATAQVTRRLGCVCVLGVLW